MTKVKESIRTRRPARKRKPYRGQQVGYLPLIPSLRCGPNDSSSDFIGDLFVVEDGDGTITTNCQKHCTKLCEFCVDPIASSSRAAVSYPRLTEAGFDSFRLGLGASSTPHGSRNHWFLRMLGEVDSAVARRLERS